MPPDRDGRMNEGLSEATAKAPEGHRRPCRQKIIHNFFGSGKAHLDRMTPPPDGPERQVVRRLTTAETPGFIAFLRRFQEFVRARTVRPFSRAFTDC